MAADFNQAIVELFNGLLVVTDLEMGAVDIAVGQRYDSKDALENRLNIIFVLQKFDFLVDRSRPHLYVVKSSVLGCQWRVRASTIGYSPIFHIRVYVSRHSCSVTERYVRARQATPEMYMKFGL